MRLAVFLLALPLFAGTATIDCGSAQDSNFTGGVVWVLPSAPPGTSDTTLRYAPAFSYRIPATGPQALRLYFTEPTVSAPGQRVFSVSLNGQPLFGPIDLARAVGLLGSVSYSAIVLPLNGFLTLNFTASVRSAVVSSIELTPLSDFLPPGPQGPQGLPGPQGIPGSTGPAGAPGACPSACPPSQPANTPNPEAANVLVVVNDATVPEDGTGGIGASQFVADHYISARGIPAGNVVHINSKGCCGFADGPSSRIYNNFHVSPQQFQTDIEQPIRAYLEAHNLKQQIKYIVTTYGVPTHIGQLPPFEQLSVDSFLAEMYVFPDTAQFGNPLFSFEPRSKPAHWTNQSVTLPIYLVTRLDGPSAVIANGLVDKALLAEKGIRKDSGTGYFDFQGNFVNPDATMLNGYNLCVAAGMKCSLNDQSKTRHMIDSAPGTLWAWGWYGGVNDVYEFAPGAVGAQLTSYTANDIRNVNNAAGAWVPFWLTKGITATWGATGEPYSNYYAMGDNVLNHLWNGYTFGEAAYISNPLLGWMMIFVGDPLYKPKFID